MNKQITKRWQSLLLATIGTVILLSGSAAYGQKSSKDKYPKPDFSAMEEYWDVVEYEYDFTQMVPELVVIAKPKQKVVPTWWYITWLDSKGVKIERFTIYFDGVNVQRSKIGEPIRGSSYAPFKRFMVQVKSVMVTERTDSPEEKTAN